MIYSITGKISERFENAVALQQGGMAFYVNVPANSYCLFSPEGEEITLYTHMQVKEDDISLYGFGDKDSLAVFKALLGVSGIGAKGALAIMALGGAGQIAASIAAENADFIQQASGIGKKTAQRVCLELKDKIQSLNLTGAGVYTANQKVDNSDAFRMEAIEVLVSLGWSKPEATEALVGVKASSAEEYIQKALRNR